MKEMGLNRSNMEKKKKVINETLLRNLKAKTGQIITS